MSSTRTKTVIAKQTRKRKADASEGSDVQVDNEPKEKRLKRYKSSPNADTMSRIYRALSQRMYLIEQLDESNQTSGLARRYAVLGSTGNVYNVTISQLPTCTCPDCARGKLCKHIIFVLARVLQVPQNSPLIYQSALLQSELKEIFEKAPAPANVQASSAVLSAYKKAVIGSQDDQTGEEQEKSTAVNEKVPEGECPICFESLQSTEQLDSCATCHNYIHKDCLRKWLAAASHPTCCYCRSAWCSFGATPGSSQDHVGGAGGVAREEGYVNLATQQGLSGRRDTSTYQSNSWRGGYGGYSGYRRYGYRGY
jgi:hypothetical protein